MVPYRRLLQSSLFVPLGHQLQLLPLGKNQQYKLKLISVKGASL